MTTATPERGRPVTVYVTAQVAGVLFALLVGWALLAVGLPVWAAAAIWLVVSAYLSRKRLPSEAIGTALQLAALFAVLVPSVPYLVAVFEGAHVGAVAIARELFGPVLVLVVVAAIAYAGGLLLKRRARRKLTKRARKDVYRSG